MAADQADLASPWLLRQLGIERSEAWLVFCGAACLFAVGWTDVSLANISEVYFLKRVGVDYLPWAFLGSSALLVVTGFALAGFVSNRDRSVLLPTTFLLLAVMLFGLWLVFRYVLPEAADWLLLISKQFKTAAMLVFWVALGDLLHGRQAKRLYAPLIAGLTLGSIAGSFASGAIGNSLGLEAILPVSAAVLAMGAVASIPLGRLIQSRLERSLSPAVAVETANPEEPDTITGLRPMWRESALFRLLVLLVILGSLVAPMLYYQFQFVANAATAGAGGEERLLDLYSQIRGWLNVAVLLVQLKIASIIYRRIGVPLSSAITPFLYIAGFIGLAFSMSLAIGVGAMVATRLSNQALHQPAIKVLFNLLPESLRARATAFLDGPLDRFGGVLGNILVLVALQVGSIAAVSALALPISLAWGVVAALIWRAYPSLLLGVSAQSRLPGSDESSPSDFLDRSTLRSFSKDLLGPDPGRCRAALSLIAEAETELAAPVLFESIQRADPERRRLIVGALVDGLEANRETENPRLANAIAGWIGEAAELDSVDRADLVWAAARLCPAGELPREIEQRLEAERNHDDASVRLVANAALRRFGKNPPGTIDLDHHIAAALELEVSSARSTARRELSELLLEAHTDDSWEQRLRSMEGLLDDAHVRVEAAEAFADVAEHHGEEASRSADAVLALREDPEPRVRAAALRFAGHAGLEDRTGLLIEALGSKTPVVAEAAQEGLLALGPGVAQALLVGHSFGRRSGRSGILAVLRQLGIERSQIQKFYEAEINELRSNLVRLYVLTSTRPGIDPIVTERLGERLDEGVRAALLFLSVLQNDNRITELEPALRRETGQRERAIVLEALESILSPSERDRILPLIDDVSLEGRVRKLAGKPGFRVPDSREATLSLLDDPDELTRTLTIATWPNGVDPRGEAARDAYREEFTDMLSPVDIVLLLKSVPLFERLTTRHLMDLARAMHEERFASGAVVCEQGDVGNCMYLVVEGEVDVVVATTTVAEMGANDFFGEMALFDGITRSASVTAKNDILVLRLDRHDLMNLMDEIPAIAIGICQALSHRLREMNREASEGTAQNEPHA